MSKHSQETKSGWRTVNDSADQGLLNNCLQRRIKMKTKAFCPLKLQSPENVDVVQVAKTQTGMREEHGSRGFSLTVVFLTARN